MTDQIIRDAIENTFMADVNERLISELERVVSKWVNELHRAGKSIDEIKDEVRAMVPSWESWRVQAYRSIRRDLCDIAEAIMERKNEATVVH